ncbi:uncharacterized protein TM35_000331230 [Trypanosoma theileri]|uniref:Uncharacterized protein n=1 Tax=Trypanosoma theileri TaxID=67003 RepID=A0A1X0NLR9_9TRYP|nr:uncharacterized protein TM35_000331230 [Trypanosoma theileri]ORC85666.1 hypothetical protein TM35_000331230 [Trypanosoma theileri]
MVSIDDWRKECTSEDHVQRQYFARNALQRNFRGDVQRRVTSSSSPSTTAVIDCCWARGHHTGGMLSTVSSALSPCLFCALSSGSVCILNTSNFVKTYLFESDTERRSQKSDQTSKKEIPNQQECCRDNLTAIDCFLLPRSGSRSAVSPSATVAATAGGIGRGTTSETEESSVIVCAVAEGWLCTFAVDADTPTHSRSVSVKAGTVHKAVELPSNDVLPSKGTWEKMWIRFSAKGSRIVVVTTWKAPCGRNTTTFGISNGEEDYIQYGAHFCVLKRREGGALDAYTVEKPWTQVSAASERTSAELLHVVWWDDDESMMLTVWTDGTVSLINLELKTIRHTSVFYSSVEQTPGRITAATAVAPITNSSINGGRSGGTPPQSGLLALVVDGNIVMVFTVYELLVPHVHATDSVEEAPLKAAKTEVNENEKMKKGLKLRPAHQTYCSEDIPVRDLALFDNFIPYTLAVLLESGALLTFDSVTMELLYHRPLQRLFPAVGAKTRHQVQEKRDDTAKTESQCQCRSYFIRPRERPMAMCVMEHNTVVVLRPP